MYLVNTYEEKYLTKHAPRLYTSGKVETTVLTSVCMNPRCRAKHAGGAGKCKSCGAPAKVTAKKELS